MDSARQWQDPADITGDLGEDIEVSQEQKERVARLVCGHKDLDAAACHELMMMLGVHPRQNAPQRRVINPAPLNRMMA